LLKTIAGETHGLEVEEGSYINYQGEFEFPSISLSTRMCSDHLLTNTWILSTFWGETGISPKTMTKNFRGEAIYTAEQDVHFPALTVGDTLAFAAEARSVSLILLRAAPSHL
jgi:hypothetical protein